MAQILAAHGFWTGLVSDVYHYFAANMIGLDSLAVDPRPGKRRLPGRAAQQSFSP